MGPLVLPFSEQALFIINFLARKLFKIKVCWAQGGCHLKKV